MNGQFDGAANANYNNSSSSSNNPYVQYSPVPTTNSATKRPMDNMLESLSQCGKRVEVATKRAEAIADSVWHHLRMSPSLTEAAMARLNQGTKVLTGGGKDKVFQQEFENLAGEKLLHSYACYLSTSHGPVIGMLYISNKRLAFCSDFCHYLAPGNPNFMHYKVVVQLDQLRTINPSANRWKPSEKYIHIVTRDGYEFWFMGFISYDKALKNLSQALQISQN
ncbi:unnamed protein product [Prunus armeniaca]|uniref:GRAM domain-containing protein n=1 Tax=Prunus armeniaca TaxID=36596 RepID=A0A6J5Y5W7_PRUAR|nr:unnamed protein product [Prunus armeniaca]